MDIRQKLIVPRKYSPKRESMSGNMKEQIECHYEDVVKVNNVAQLTEVQWTGRAIWFKRILDNYAAQWNLWQHTLHNNNLQTDVKSRIIGDHHKKETFDFFFGLDLSHSVLTY